MIRVVLLAGVLSLVSGCRPAESPTSPRAQGRAALALLAHGLKAAGVTCANVGRSMAQRGQGDNALALLERCDHAYDAGVAALLAAEAALDASQAPTAACSMPKALEAVGGICVALEAAGARCPGLVTDSVEVTQRFVALVPCGGAS